MVGNSPTAARAPRAATRRRAAEQRDELAPPHSITSSAIESSARRHSMPSALRRFQVDDELEFGRLQHRQVGRLGALEDVAGIDADLMKHIREVGAVAHQAAGRDNVAVLIGSRKSVARRQGGKLHAATVEETVGTDEEGIGPLARKAWQRPHRSRRSSWR